MKKVLYGQKLYYSDERNDDFTDFKATLIRPVDKMYRYESRNPFFRFFSFVLYYLIAVPVLWIICKIAHGVRVEDRKNLRSVKGGCVIYSNHVNTLDCAFSFVCAAAPRRCYIVCNPDAVHMPVVRHIVKMLGALPVPADLAAFKNFTKAVDGKIKKGRTLVVMPEAHIWPYYTGIRSFPSTSFSYAAKNNVPAVPVCVVYRKPKGLFKNYLCPRVTLKVGKPVYPEANVSVKANASAMRDKVYEFMTECSHLNEISLYDYIKTTEKVDTRTQLRALKIARKQRAKAKRHLYEFGKKVYGEKAPSFFTDTFSTADNEMEEALETGYLDERHPKE